MKDFMLIAGPCAVESEEQIIRIALKLKKMGIEYLRGGAFKLRTSPDSFQGLGDTGMKYLIKAKMITGMKIVTEVTSIEMLNKYKDDIDVIQIGARNMYNYDLLKEVGKINKPVLLKRAFSATYNEWINAAKYIINEGNNNVILCERGIRTFEPSTRNTLDIEAVSYIKHNTDFKIIVDPSHATGLRYMVKPMSLASFIAGCDGLEIEVHDDIENALSDKNQAITPEELQEIINDIKKINNIFDKN